MTVEITLFVSSVFAGPHGGAVFSGRDQSGGKVRAVADRRCIYRSPQRGEAWRLAGTFIRDPTYGQQLRVDKAWPVKPEGGAIAHYLAHHAVFRGIGIGPAKAARLSKTFGAELVALLDQGDTGKLGQVVGGQSAGQLVQRWRENTSEASVVSFLDSHGADVRLASKVLRYWPDRTIEKLRENPYRLLFLAGWPAADRLAASLGVPEDDERRLAAAVESVVYGHLHAEKDTLVGDATLEAGVSRLLGQRNASAARRAIDLAAAEGTIVGNRSDGYQAFGCAVMESSLAARFRSLSADEAQQDTARRQVQLEDDIVAFECANGITLNAEQRAAVRMAVTRRFSVLKGGAGVGKTTVLKAVCALVEARNGRVIQMALAGRAAQRMREATGREAFTIAGVINRIKQQKLAFGPDDLVVVDESSMLDVILMYRLMRMLPDRVRLLLVGDPFQLPPIGPGLVFHVLTDSPGVPQQELTQVHRQAEGSAIPAIAKEIREGRAPRLDRFTGPAQGVALVEATGRHTGQAVIDVMRSLEVHGEVQILGVRKRGDAGTEALNGTLHELFAARNQSLAVWGIAESEPVIHLVNDYDRDLFNGSLGRVRRIATERSPAGNTRHFVECDFDGVMQRFDEDSLDRIDLAHAITVHKAQGSQFRRVVIPVTPSRLLDRTLIYTALTRAVEQAVFVGDGTALARAIEAPPHSERRSVGFHL